MRKPSINIFQTVAIIILAFGLIALGFGGYLSPIFSIVVKPVISLQTKISEQYSYISKKLNTPKDIDKLLKENAELEAEVSKLQNQIIVLQQQLYEYQVLSALLDFARANPEFRYTSASVIGKDPSPFLHYIIINRGSDDGIKRGMPVVSEKGLIGRISNVIPAASRVQLITDPRSRLSIRIQPTNVEGILSGSITGELVLDFIPQDANISTSDLVLTSGLGGDYPPNILIGQVSGIKKQDYALFQSGSVQPTVDFTKLEIVLIITNFKPINISPLIPTQESP